MIVFVVICIIYHLPQYFGNKLPDPDPSDEKCTATALCFYLPKLQFTLTVAHNIKWYDLTWDDLSAATIVFDSYEIQQDDMCNHQNIILRDPSKRIPTCYNDIIQCIQPAQAVFNWDRKSSLLKWKPLFDCHSTLSMIGRFVNSQKNALERKLNGLTTQHVCILFHIYANKK
jgi:hypothetical protein